MVRSLALLILSGLVACAPSPGPGSAPIEGAFALQAGVQRTTAFMRGHELWFTPLDSQALLGGFDPDMGVDLHAIFVSGDFRVFEHLHPQLEPNEHFNFQQPLPRFGYYLFVDVQPHGFGHQVFRFAVGIPNVRARPDLSESATRSTAGPYAISLTGSLHSGADSLLTVHITKNAMPATDLHPYLGALGHAVFINAIDLSYLHVHPMPLTGASDAMAGAMAAEAMLTETSPVPAAMALRVRVVRPGPYKLWLQFRGGSQVYAAPFVLRAT